MFKNNVKNFMVINSIEGYSYVLLLFVAMPLKYMLEIAVAVKIVGMIHGILFILFCILLVQVNRDGVWKIKNSIIYFIASLIPFGTFFTAKSISTYESAGK